MTESVSIFMRRVSGSPKLKLKLAWLTFLVLGVPMAVFTSLGLPQQVALPVVLALAIPAQYAVFAMIESYGGRARVVGALTLLGESAAGCALLVVLVYLRPLLELLVKQ